MSFWSQTAKLITGVEPSPKSRFKKAKKLTHRDLIRMESHIGSQLFGAVPAGHRREFFCLDKDTWVWYEQYMQNGKVYEVTTRYEIHPHGVLKVQDGQPYAVVEGEELRNLAIATRIYHDRVAREVYNRDPITGASLAA